MRPFLPFAKPDIGEEEIAEVVDSLKSGWISTGPKTKRFEEDFREWLGISDGHTIAVNSATAGLHLALEAIGIGPEDEVIVPTYTFTSTAEVIRYLGAHPVFVDICPHTYNLDPELIESKITSKTKAIMPVHFAGLSCNMTSILEIARRYRLRVVEDAAHALPSTYDNQRIGTLESDVTVFSFYATKTLATGEGGMIVTRDDQIAKRCRIMRLHGIDRDAFDRYTSQSASWYYEVVAPGFKYNMADISASLGIHQLKKVEKFRKVRAEMATYYDQHFSDLPIVLPPKGSSTHMHAWHLYVIQVPHARDQFIEKMSQAGIGCSVHFIPLHLHPYWKKNYHFKDEDFPHALSLYQQAVSLPLYTKMTKEDQAYVIEVVKRTLVY